MSRHYRRFRGSSANTCSIKFLKNAYIGAGVRITGGPGTVPFNNEPMTNVRIDEYTQQGFRISHPSLPKQAWVDFDQLPLTRLKIINGVIQDEITFVENIVNHKMQFIRTLDTEYIDLMYAEKELESKKDLIIPISKAIPGEIYIGAQCKEGTEMIYLGTFYTKSLQHQRFYVSYNTKDETKYYLSDTSPQTAYFLVPCKDLTKAETARFEKEYNFWDYTANYDRRMEMRDLYYKAVEEYKRNISEDRFKIVEYPITNKRIKNVIITHKSNELFKDIHANRDALLNTVYSDYPKSNENIFLVGSPTANYISLNKTDIDNIAKGFIQKYSNGLVKIENCKFSERYNNK